VDDYSAVIRALESGRVVVIPTDTVYGLAVMPGIPGAVDELFRMKGRAGEKPLAILGATARALSGIASFDDRASALAGCFWPGPLTMVLPRAPGFTTALGPSDTPGVAVRVPRNEIASEILGLAGALAVTSANRSGEPPATTADDARAEFENEVAFCVDGGTCSAEPSSVISLLGAPEVLRVGPISAEDVAKCLGE
jgi:L-threonylcarbamoyladenylate synthase